MTTNWRTLVLVSAGILVFCATIPAQESRPADQRERAEAEALLAQLKRDVEDPSKLGTVRVLLDKAIAAAATMGKEYKAAVREVLGRLTFNTLKVAVDAARAKEAARDNRGALAAYDDATAAFGKYFDVTGGSTPREVELIIALYKEMIAESDKLVERVETPEYEASIPERDMLSTKERAFWGKSVGIDYTFSGSEILITGVPVENSRITGVASVLPPTAAPWHDVVVDLEFTILQGDFETYLRYDVSKKSYLVKFAPKEGYELNKPYRMTIHVKGSQISLKAPEQSENRDKFSLNTSRTGGLGFGLNAGSRIVISSCKLKILR